MSNVDGQYNPFFVAFCNAHGYDDPATAPANYQFTGWIVRQRTEWEASGEGVTFGDWLQAKYPKRKLMRPCIVPVGASLRPCYPHGECLSGCWADVEVSE